MRLLTSACCTSLVCAIAVVSFVPAWAEPEEPLEVKEVVVSSTRLPDTPVDARTLPAKVTVITAEQMRKSGARSVQEAIQWATGIVMYDQVGNAFQQSIDLRGFNGQPVPATSVFVDGVRVNEPDFNTTNFDLIPFESIERIEIVPGASAIYGKNALGGVINIITKRGGEKHQVAADGHWGSFQRQRYTINASGPVGKFDYNANFGREMETGYRDDSGASISRFSGRVGYRPFAQTDLSVSYNYVKDKLHQAGQLPLTLAEVDPKRNFTPGDLDVKELNFVRGTLRQGMPLGFSLNGNVFYRHLDQDLFNVGQPFFVGGALSSGATSTKTEQRGGTGQLTHDSAWLGFKNQLIGGGELIQNNFASHFSTSGGVTDSVAEEQIAAAYVQDTFHLLPNLLLTGGLRYDHERITVDSRSVFFGFPSGQTGTLRYYRTTPRGGITLLVSENWSAYYNYSEGFRVPTSQEMFTLNGLPNLSLKPIRSKNHEIGFRGRIGTVVEGTVAFYHSTSNDIFFTCDAVCDPFNLAFDGQNRNAEKVRRRGVETTLKARWNNYVDAVVNYSYTESEFRSSFNLSQTKTVQVGNQFPLVPRHRVGVILNTHPVEGLTISLTSLYVGSQVYLNDENNVQPKLPQYFVMNARIAYEHPVPGGRLSGFLLVNNLTNNRYFTFGSIAGNTLTGNGSIERFVIPAPTIAFYGGLSYRFDGFPH